MVYPRALLACAVLVLLLGAGADDDLERLMPDVEVAPCPRLCRRPAVVCSRGLTRRRRRPALVRGCSQAAIRKSFKAEAEGRLEDALRAVDSDLPLAVARHPIVRYRAGKVFMQRRSWAEAVAALHAACEGDPRQPGAQARPACSMRPPLPAAAGAS